MSQSPDDLLKEKKAEAVVEFTLIGTLLGGPAACGCAILGGVAGAVASKLMGTPDDISWAIGGTVATALAVVLPVRLLSPAHRTVVGTVLWVAAAVVAVGVLNWHIGSRYEWPILRWALCGLVIGAFVAPIHAPAALAEEDFSFVQYGKVVLDLASLVAVLIRMVNRSWPGVLVAGGLGGLFGGVAPALMAFNAATKVKEMEELFGNPFAVPIAILVLSMAGGVLGGWGMWQQSRRPHPPVDSPPS
jgi:hypothetical protein